MTNLTREAHKAYRAFDQFVRDWVEVADATRSDFFQDRNVVLRAIDAVVEEAYQCGYNDARDQQSESEEMRIDGGL